MKQCSFCQKSVYKLAAHGLCAACYYREKRNGTPDYVKVRKPCSVDGCEKLSVANGLCDMHYRRWRNHGTPVGERFDRWGHADYHPLYQTHRRLIRDRVPMVMEWNDFWTFTKDVGDRPTNKHRLTRQDFSKELGPSNFFWKPPRTDVIATDAATHAERQRAYRAANPEIFRRLHLKKKFGISLEMYDQLLDEQRHTCAICGRPEKTIIRGKLVPLAVDHDHNTGSVRGLLCVPCNRGLGLFKDDLSILEKAIAYLKKFQT